MPWKTRGTMSLKEEFILEFINQTKNISELCREFNISRPTAYKWIERYKEKGVDGLKEYSKRPLFCPHRIETKEMELILKQKDKYPAWGAKKLRQTLINEGYEKLPSVATFNRVLKYHEKIDIKESEKRKHYIRFERQTPNELWQMDFKGHFRLLEGRCHPLTVLDDYSRYSIVLKACLREDEISVRNALEEAFYEFGIPDAMTMDNGSPWKGSSPFRLSRLTVWLMRLGIKVSHSTPYHPQTQGKDERFHRSLKEEVLKYHQFKDLYDAQRHFNDWRQLYNEIRPHEGIGLLRPKDRYIPSLRPFPNKLPPIEYKVDDEVRKVGRCGQIAFKGKDYFIGEHLRGEYVAVRQRNINQWDIYFCTTRIGGFKV